MNVDTQAIRWLWIVWALYWFVSAFSAQKTVRRESWASMLKQRVFLLPGYVLLFLPLTASGLNLR